MMGKSSTTPHETGDWRFTPVIDLRQGSIAGLIAEGGSDLGRLLSTLRQLRAARLMSAGFAQPLWISLPAKRLDGSADATAHLTEMIAAAQIPPGMLKLRLSASDRAWGGATGARPMIGGVGVIYADGDRHAIADTRGDIVEIDVPLAAADPAALLHRVRALQAPGMSVLVRGLNGAVSGALAQAAGARFGAGPVFGHPFDGDQALAALQQHRSVMREGRGSARWRDTAIRR